MRIYDVSLTISPDLLVWPGDPDVVAERVQKIEEGALSNVTRLELSAHTGTHVDAPYHFIQNGKTVENLSLKLLIGRAYVVHIPDADLITRAVIEEAGIPPRTRRVLFKTKNSKYWARKNHKEFNTNYVALAPDAAETLIQRGVKLVGVDYLSIAPFEDLAETHNVLLNAGVVIVEGLDLSQVDPGRYTFYCLPLKIAGADGAPARALLIGV
ncbi:MAG TPA: cyclase family protein [Anaerolineales bacterium]|nr:cyclase family protein [Anaerolineales bacterium]